MSELMKLGGIYEIRNIINGKIYIGSTRQFAKRKREHFSTLRNGTHVNRHLQSAFNKHGQSSFSFNVIEVVDKQGDLIAVEQFHLDNLNVCDPAIGYNLSRTARSYVVKGEAHHHFGVPKSAAQRRKTSEALKGRNHSTETKAKISAAVKGKNMGADHWSYGKERSQEHRAKHSASMKGKFVGAKAPTARAVVQLTVEGEYVQSFDTGKQAADALGVSRSNISNSCSKGKRKVGGFKWMYLEDYLKKVGDVDVDTTKEMPSPIVSQTNSVH